MDIRIENISQSELEDLLSTATYGSSWLECHILKSESNLDNQQEFQCREEHWAYRLLNGGHLVCCDHYDEDEDDENNPVEHIISMEDFYKGLEKANELFPDTFANVMRGEGDYYDADAVMQVVLFGKMIYG